MIFQIKIRTPRVLFQPLKSFSSFFIVSVHDWTTIKLSEADKHKQIKMNFYNTNSICCHFLLQTIEERIRHNAFLAHGQCQWKLHMLNIINHIDWTVCAVILYCWVDCKKMRHGCKFSKCFWRNVEDKDFMFC